jgi:hypothetical protein
MFTDMQAAYHAEAHAVLADVLRLREVLSIKRRVVDRPAQNGTAVAAVRVNGTRAEFGRRNRVVSPP